MSTLTRSSVDAAAEIIKRGGIVCFPTESTYGLAVLWSHNDAIARLATIKGRGTSAPFGLIVSSIDEAQSLVTTWPDEAEQLAQKYWPGPLTIVLRGTKGLHRRIVGKGGGVGFRMSSHPEACALVKRVGAPITATSANRKGQANATSIRMARHIFGDEVDYYLDGGICDGPPSTFVSICDGKIDVLREGPVIV